MARPDDRSTDDAYHVYRLRCAIWAIRRALPDTGLEVIDERLGETMAAFDEMLPLLVEETPGSDHADAIRWAGIAVRDQLFWATLAIRGLDFDDAETEAGMTIDSIDSELASILKRVAP